MKLLVRRRRDWWSKGGGRICGRGGLPSGLAVCVNVRAEQLVDWGPPRALRFSSSEPGSKA